MAPAAAAQASAGAGNGSAAEEEVPEVSARAQEATGIARAVAELDQGGSTLADYFATSMDVLTFSAMESEAKCLSAPGNPRLGCTLQGCPCTWLEVCYPKYLQDIDVGSCQASLWTFGALSVLIFVVSALGVSVLRAALISLTPDDEEAKPPPALMSTDAPIRIKKAPLPLGVKDEMPLPLPLGVKDEMRLPMQKEASTTSTTATTSTATA